MSVQFAESDSADFEKNTWTFRMEGSYFVQGGRFAIMPEHEYRKICEEHDLSLFGIEKERAK